MTTAYTSLLGLALPVTGELSGTWGDTVNNSITSLLDTSVAGTTNVSTDTDVTLTTTTGAANTARQAILLFSGARTALRTVTAPAQSKIYTVINATTGGFSVKLVGAGPTTGLTIPNGASAVVAWNGSDFVEIGAGSIGNLIVNGTLTVTGATTLQSTLAVTGNITNTAGTANGVAYLNGSKVVTSGSALQFDGNNFGVGGTPNGYGSTYTVATINNATDGAVLDLNLAGTRRATFFTTTVEARIGSITNIPFSFYQNNTEQMRLTSTGLGIGTSSPSAKLQIGTGGAAGLVDTVFLGGNSTNTAQFRWVWNHVGAGYLGIGTASDAYGAMIFGQASGATGAVTTEWMRIDGSGNLGLGVTPSAWNGALIKAIQIGDNNGSISSFTTGNTGSDWIFLNNNAYYDGSWKYIASSTAAQYALTSSEHRWFTAPSGTAGNAITFTQAMTLDASGNLGVGTTSPSRFIDFEKNQNASTILRVGNTTSGTGAYAALQLSSSSATYLYNFSNAYTTSGIFVAGATVLDAGGSGGLLFNAASVGILFNTGSTERARIDNSGNLLIGRTSTVNGAKVMVAAPASGVAYGTEWNDGVYMSQMRFDASYYVGVLGNAATRELRLEANSSDSNARITFYTGGSGTTSERARIDSSGTLFVVKTSTVSDVTTAGAIIFAAGKCVFTTTTNEQPLVLARNNTTGVLIEFYYGGSSKGSISTDGTNVAYNTSSDYRLKNTIAPMTGALAKVALLKPCTYKWNVDGSDGEGFIAHELAEVVPQCVSGEKDAVDDKGNPKYQGVDTSFLVATLTAAIQEQQAIIDSLKARLDAANL